MTAEPARCHGRGLKIDEKVELDVMGGMGDVTDMGRWREKKAATNISAASQISR
jgi:hypothetical protein